jgi:hypothetical protein
VEHYDEGVSEDSRRVDIDGLEEARYAALVQSATYLEGIRRYHDRNVKELFFNVGDLVPRRIQNTEEIHKLSSPWEGPFTVAKVTRPGSYRLQTLEGEDVNNSWNVDQLCRYYAYSTRLPRGLKSTRLHQDPSAVSSLRVQAPVSGLLLRRKRPPGSRHQSPDYPSPESNPCGYLRILGCDERQRTLAAVY